jgi:hypothetical protein
VAESLLRAVRPTPNIIVLETGKASKSVWPQGQKHHTSSTGITYKFGESHLSVNLVTPLLSQPNPRGEGVATMSE